MRAQIEYLNQNIRHYTESPLLQQSSVSDPLVLEAALEAILSAMRFDHSLLAEDKLL
jgi:hypothetical protein